MFTSNDMVYNTDKHGIQSGGMKVNSILLKNGDPLGYSKHGGSITKMLDDLVVPVGLIYLQQHIDKRTNNDGPMILNNEPISDSIYDRILGIDSEIKENTKKKKTHRRRKHNKKTRKK